MIKKRVPDKFKARSMLEAAEADMKFTKTLAVSKESGSTIVRNVYDCFRKLGDSLLLIRGKEAVGRGQHNDAINELLRLQAATKRPIQILGNLKDLRNNISYEAYIPSVEETEDALSVADACFKPIVAEIEKELSKL
ncbi:MAG TPA: hypothetical protein VJC07_05480 [Candidatus Nanoarchaeia archaeon]|nr:hypothetical protein [Candidatus Nanoarchaeia archaeon]